MKNQIKTTLLLFIKKREKLHRERRIRKRDNERQIKRKRETDKEKEKCRERQREKEFKNETTLIESDMSVQYLKKKKKNCKE